MPTFYIGWICPKVHRVFDIVLWEENKNRFCNTLFCKSTTHGTARLYTTEISCILQDWFSGSATSVSSKIIWLHKHFSTWTNYLGFSLVLWVLDTYSWLAGITTTTFSKADTFCHTSLSSPVARCKTQKFLYTHFTSKWASPLRSMELCSIFSAHALHSTAIITPSTMAILLLMVKLCQDLLLGFLSWIKTAGLR